MLYLLISILCSVSVGVFFKLLKKKSSVTVFLLVINYLIASIATYILFQPQFDYSKLNWNYIIPLSLLLPTVFWILSIAINQSGIVKTDIAQRISLIIPILCSYWLFKEEISNFKLTGLIIGLIAVVFILQKNSRSKASGAFSFYLLLTFLGYGVIDVLFKQIALHSQIPYTTSLFFIFLGAFIITTSYLSFNQKTLKTITIRHFINGIILGILNFSNIYFYLKAHQYFKENPTTVFASMNFGVIILGTLIGIVFFKEKLTKVNIIGLILALIAVAFIVIAQTKSI